MQIPIDKQEPAVIFEVELAGKTGTYFIDMVLDTGSTFIIAPWGVIESLGYDPAASKKRVTITTASTTESCPVVTIERIAVADLEIENPEIVVHDIPPMSRVDGLLGLDFLKAFDTHLDYKNQILEIKDP